MIIFPFGFYILDGKRPIYIGNDLEAQKTMRAWIEANPNRVRLCSDVIGPVLLVTKFLGCDESSLSAKMSSEPQLFETTSCENEQVTVSRRYADHDAALAGHAQFVAIAKGRLH